MATRKQTNPDESVRKLTKSGQYTYYVTIPKSVILEMGWKERQKLVIKKSGKNLIISDWEK